MMNFSHKSLKDIIDLILGVNDSLTKSRCKELKRLYMTIYYLLKSIQDSNELFLNWLEHTNRFNTVYYFRFALDEIPKIEHLIIKIFDTIGCELSNNTIQNLMHAQDPELYRAIRNFIGAKFQHIRFLKSALEQLSENAKAIKKQMELSDEPEINVMILNMPQIDILSHRYDYLKYSVFPDTCIKKNKLNNQFIKCQISETKEIINELNDLLMKYSAFIQKNIQIEDIL